MKNYPGQIQATATPTPIANVTYGWRAEADTAKWLYELLKGQHRPAE